PIIAPLPGFREIGVHVEFGVIGNQPFQDLGRDNAVRLAAVESGHEKRRLGIDRDGERASPLRILLDILRCCEDEVSDKRKRRQSRRGSYKVSSIKHFLSSLFKFLGHAPPAGPWREFYRRLEHFCVFAPSK